MFNSEFAGQIAWLIPSALLLGTALLWIGRQAARTDGVRTSVVVWGCWVLFTALTFSFMSGIIHPYYAVALAPGIAGLTGLGAALLWERRSQTVAAFFLAAAVTAAGLTAYGVLGQTPAFLPWLRWLVLALSLLASVLLLVASRTAIKSLCRAAAALAVTASLAGSLAYSLSTAATTHSGAIVSAGPSATLVPGGAGRAGFGRLQQNSPPPNLRQNTQGGSRQGAGGMGGLLGGASTPSAELVAALKAGAARYTWAAAVVGSNNAAGYQLATELPVMAVGGFNGTDPAPTLEQFRQLVAEGRIHYFIAGQIMAGDSGSEAATEIAAWVKSTFTPSTIGGVTVYDLSQ
jgi:hypothetical protein